jgi:dUTP pyrophosphatase
VTAAESEERAIPAAGALGRESLARLLDASAPLIEHLRDRAAQLQPNGIDLTIDRIWHYSSDGSLGGPTRARLPEREIVEPTADGWYRLAPGPYVVALHEWVRMPTFLMALARPRSTLLRIGAQLHTAVWDAGYEGRPETLLVVNNPFGIALAAEAAICQIVFFTLTERVEGYHGAYQGR